MAQLYAGAARRCIDPTPDMFPMPTRFNVMDAIYDSCFVRAIALRCGDTQALLVIFELSDHPTVEGLKAKLAEASGFPEDSVFISFTHNHTSPCDEANRFYGRPPEAPELTARREAYKQIELTASCEAAAAAAASMRPARIGYGTVDSYVNVNRDFKNRHGYWVEAPNYAGYSDKTLAGIKLVDTDGKLIAALMNHGTHSTCAFISKDSDGLYKTSGNFSGVATKFAERYFGEDTVIAWTAGAAGNQNPIMSHGLQYEYPDGYTTAVTQPDGTAYMVMEYVGRRHGSDIITCLESINEYSDEIGIEHRETLALLPAQKKRTFEPGKRINNRMGGNGLRDWEKDPYGELAPIPTREQVMEPDPEHPVKMYMHLLKLGDIALILTNGEMYAELGREIKKASPMEKTVVMTYSTAASTSYILDRSSVDHLVFQSFSPAMPGYSDEPILNGVKELFAD